MVKVGFICEGTSDKVILTSHNFISFLQTIGIKTSEELILSVGGDGEISDKRRIAYRQILRDKGAQAIIILRDLDNNICPTELKKTYTLESDEIIIFAIKEIESWFLADSETMNSFLDVTDFHIEAPENESEPFETIRKLFVKHIGRGFGKNKLILAKNIITKGFNIKNAAKHKNRKSAHYFCKKLASINL